MENNIIIEIPLDLFYENLQGDFPLEWDGPVVYNKINAPFVTMEMVREAERQARKNYRKWKSQ
jgi:hypothetical protein